MSRAPGRATRIGRWSWLPAAAALLLAACNVNITLDDERLEQVIRDGIQGQTELTVTSVDCPDDRPLKADDVFECTADLADGSRLTITVTQTDAAGNVSWEVTGSS